MSTPSANYSALKFSELIPRFLLTARAEYKLSQETQSKYGECLKQFLKFSPDKPIADYSDDDLLSYSLSMLDRKLSVSRQTSLLLALKRFLKYCKEKLGLVGIDPETIIPPERLHRDVIFLRDDEIARFVAAVPLLSYRGDPLISNVRFRALVEVLLGTGIRISEALSLNRISIDRVRREAKVIGKGDKERVIFFTARSLHWLDRYLALRTDSHEALFVTAAGRSRLKRDDVWRPFKRFTGAAGLNTRVTPHILRHTTATLLLNKGCPMNHIQGILGHARLDTTCRFYLGLDLKAAKVAHEKYLTF